LLSSSSECDSLASLDHGPLTYPFVRTEAIQ
jgi:hypothetical protein